MNDAPEKIHLIPDDFHIKHVGRLADGRLFLVDSQLDTSQGPTRDFVCSYFFAPEGHLVGQKIELVGSRDEVTFDDGLRIFDRHLAELGPHEIRDIWIRPFAVIRYGLAFGFIPMAPEEFGEAGDAGWSVVAMPGNTLSFYPPWEEGLYDT